MSKGFLQTPIKDSSTMPAVSKFVNTVENSEQKKPQVVDTDL